MPRPEERPPTTSSRSSARDRAGAESAPTAAGRASGRRSYYGASSRRGGWTKLDGLFIGGGVVLGGVIAAVLLVLGGGSVGGPSEAGGGAAAKAPDASSAPKTAAPANATIPVPELSEEEKKRDRRIEYLRNSAAVQNAAGHLKLADWCEKNGLAEEAKAQLTRAARKDPDGRDGRLANGKLGLKRYVAPLDITVRELEPYLGRFLTPAEMAEADALVARARERVKTVAEEEAKDPWLKNAHLIAKNNLLDHAMKNFNLTVSYHKPYVVFVESEVPLPSGGMLATGEAIPVSDLTQTLQTVHKEHGHALAANLENYVAKYGHLIHNYKPETDVFLFFSFQGRKSFEAYQVLREPRSKPESFVRAYYIPITREVISYLREADDAPMTTPVHVVCHEAIHQLTHHFEKGSVKGKNDKAIPSAYWFQEGFAEYLSPASDKPLKDPVTGKESYDFGGLLRGRLIDYAKDKANGVFLPIDKLIWNDQPQAISELYDTMKNSPLPNEKKTQIASVAFYGQAWFFVHFLNHFDGGKYKDAFEKQVANELNAKSRPVDFIRFLGIQMKTETDKFNALQDEMDKYLEELKTQM